LCRGEAVERRKVTTLSISSGGIFTDSAGAVLHSV
jgi:hypothetical protein